MALSRREERAAANIEAGLRADTSWSGRVDALAARLDRRDRVPYWLPVVCLVGGLAFLFTGRQRWLSLELAVVSGVPAASVRLALVAIAATALLAAALLLGRAAFGRFASGGDATADDERVTTSG